MDIQLFVTECGAPWGVWAEGHVDQAAFLKAANEQLRTAAFQEVELSEVEFVHARHDGEQAEYNLIKSAADAPGAFPITWVPGESICAADDL